MQNYRVVPDPTRVLPGLGDGAVDAARAQPGHATPGELRDWFWLETSAARLVAAAALAMKDHPDLATQMLALRAMVPREYLGTLAPAIDPVAWRALAGQKKGT